MSILFSNCGILAWKDDRFLPIEKGFLGVDGDTITYVGANRPDAKFDEEKDMTGRLLMPGLVNSHCHAAMTLLRGVGSDLPLQEWLFDKIFPVEDRLTPEIISAGNELAMLEMLSTGTTSFTDMYMEPTTAIEAAAKSGIKLNVTRPVQCFDPNETADRNAHLKEAIPLFDRWHGAENGRIRVDFCLHAEYTCTDPIARALGEAASAAADRGAHVHVHMSETAKEHSECVERHGCTPAAWFEKMGVFDVPAYAAHCVFVTDEDMEIMRRRGVTAIHNPTSNMKLGSGFAPIPTMIERGINVALGTDGAASNNNLNMFEEMHLAAILHNGYHRDAVLMKPEEVLKMATVNGAKAQGRFDTGALEVGKKADVIAIDFRNKPHLYPAFDPMTMLVYSAQGSDVCMTMVDGKILYENGKFTTLDADKVYANARAAVNQLYGGTNA